MMKYENAKIIVENTFAPRIIWNNFYIPLKITQIEDINSNMDNIDNIIDQYLYNNRTKIRKEKLKNILNE